MIRKIIKEILNIIINFYSKVINLNFPEKYGVKWKLDFIFENYEIGTTNLVKKVLKKDATVIDIGAHIGYFTRIFSKLVGAGGVVYAFEPDKKNYNLLSNNVSKKNNIHIYNKAISNGMTRLTFYHKRGSTGCHSLIKPRGTVVEHTVQTTTLDNFLKINNIEHVDLIKMDIEGGEFLALQGMAEILKRQKELMMIIELNSKNLERGGSSTESLINLIRSFNLKIKIIKENSLISLDKNSDYMSYLNKMGETNLFCYKNNYPQK